MQERLDYIFITNSLHNRVLKAEILPAFKSDHSFPIVEIAPEGNIVRGHGYWKLNTKLLENVEYVEETTKIIEQITKEQSDILLRWELIKIMVRGFSIKFSARKTKAKRKTLEVLNRKLKQLEQEESTQLVGLSKSKEQQQNLIQKDIEEIITESTQGAKVRCQVNWHDAGEKSSKYYLNLEKYNANRKNLSKVMLKDGTITSDQEKILEVEKQYYQKLYTETPVFTDIDKYLENIIIPKIKDEDRDMLEGPILLEEVHIAVKQMSYEKASGYDGLPIEFYDKFWNILSNTLHSLMIKYTQINDMNKSAKEGIITLIDKPGKNPLEVANWRGLTMLCCDYKIFAKIIANRMQLVQSEIIHQDQKGFMKGRDIADNLMELLSTIEYCKQYNKKALILAFDFEKAFDKVNWKALDRIMQVFNFGPKFREMTTTCLSNFTSYVMNQGHRSDSIKITRGLKQGCPLSPSLFNLIAEIIAIKIRQNKNIKGIVVNKVEKKLGQFADDIWTATEYDELSYKETLKTFNEFANYTGLQINYNKTEVLRIGSLQGSDATFYSRLPLQWSDGPVSILGLKVTGNIVECAKINYEEILSKIQSVYDAWLNRALTLMGKIQVINSLIISKAIYRLQVLPNPNKAFYDKYYNMQKEFLWDKKAPKIRKSLLINEKEAGGLKLQDIKIRNKALKARWVIRESSDYLNQLKAKLLKLPSTFEIKEANVNKTDVEKKFRNQGKVNNIWVDVWKAWCEINYHKPKSPNDIKNQYIHSNSHIKREGKPYIWTKIVGKINRIEQIWDSKNKSFQKYEKIREEHGDTLDMISYITLTRSVPKEWVKILKMENPPLISVEGGLQKIKSKLKNKGSVAKVMYVTLLQKVTTNNLDKRYKWEMELGTEIKDKVWTNLVKNTERLTLSTKLRYFQYKIINRSLTMNTHVAKWNKEQSEMCTFCNEEVESYMHCFVQCDISKKIWGALKKWLDYFCFVKLEITPFTLLFNAYTDSFELMINTIILIVKYHLYCCKCKKEQPKFSNIIRLISWYKNIEYYVAKKHKKLTKHNKKWEMYDKV